MIHTRNRFSFFTEMSTRSHQRVWAWLGTLAVLLPLLTQPSLAQDTSAQSFEITLHCPSDPSFADKIRNHQLELNRWEKIDRDLRDQIQVILEDIRNTTEDLGRASEQSRQIWEKLSNQNDEFDDRSRKLVLNRNRLLSEWKALVDLEEGNFKVIAPLVNYSKELLYRLRYSVSLADLDRTDAKTTCTILSDISATFFETDLSFLKDQILHDFLALSDNAEYRHTLKRLWSDYQETHLAMRNGFRTVQRDFCSSAQESFGAYPTLRRPDLAVTRVQVQVARLKELKQKLVPIGLLFESEANRMMQSSMETENQKNSEKQESHALLQEIGIRVIRLENEMNYREISQMQIEAFLEKWAARKPAPPICDADTTRNSAENFTPLTILEASSTQTTQ